MKCKIFPHYSNVKSFYFFVSGIEGEFQLRTVLSTIERKGWQVSRRGAKTGRLSVQWTNWLSRGEWSSLFVEFISIAGMMAIKIT